MCRGDARRGGATGPLPDGIPLYVSPSVGHALEQLGVLLDDYHYSPHARGRILSYAAAHGTPTGCADLDREDEADATEVFVAELGPVDSDSPAWAREDVFLDAELLAAGTHPWPLGPMVGDDDRTGPSAADERRRRPHRAQRGRRAGLRGPLRLRMRSRPIPPRPGPPAPGHHPP